jgi:biotin operon repressor
MAKKVDCFICGKNNLTHNEVGLNKKLVGKNVQKIHCMQCLAEYLGVSVDELEERMQEFKEAGCTLFE